MLSELSGRTGARIASQPRLAISVLGNVSVAFDGREIRIKTRKSRALLAYLSNREIADYLASAEPLTRYDAIFPETADATAQDVWDDIARVRRDGFITWRNPQQYSANYVAFPVLDANGRPHALVTVGGPFERFGPDRIERLMPQLSAALVPLQQQCRHVSAAPVIVEGAP